MEKPISYLILSITFPGIEELDYKLNEYIEHYLSDFSSGWKWVSSNCLKSSDIMKSTRFCVEIWEMDEYIVDDIVYKIVTIPQLSNANIEWFFLNQESAESEGFFS